MGCGVIQTVGLVSVTIDEQKKIKDRLIKHGSGLKMAGDRVA